MEAEGLVKWIRDKIRKPEIKVPIIEHDDYRGGWRHGSIEHPRQPKGGRSLVEYEQLLGFNRRELNGMAVLDLGAGPQVKLTTQLAESGVNARIVEFSPDFNIKKYRDEAKVAGADADIVAGLGQQLPFASEEFDRIFVLQVTVHLPSLDAQNLLIEEIGRVLKKGGKAYIAPLGPEDRLHLTLDNTEIIDYLTQLNIVIKSELIPEEYFRTHQYYPSGVSAGLVPGWRVILEKLN